MGDIVLAGSTSGTTTLTPTAVSGTTTLTLPATTDTLVGKTTTDTLTNKSIVATQLTGTIAAARLPTGSVLQVVQATNSTEATNSTSIFADTGLTVTITPISNTSKILIIANLAVAKPGALDSVLLNIVRNATQIIVFSAGILYTGTAVYLNGMASVCYLDSPATTSATTYKIQFRNSANQAYVHAMESGSTGTIIVMEIAA